MQRLKRPSREGITYYDEIVGAKREPRRQRLHALRAHIESRYGVYVSAGNRLELLSPVPLPNDDVEALAHCYEASTAALDKLKVEIRTSQTQIWQRLCPYCAIDTSATFDHYLCKTNFPEFSVLSDNLVPACSICNTAKGDRELDGGQRRFVHFYVDDIPDARWLECRIVVVGGEPEAQFEVVFPVSVPARAQAIIGEHYSRLSLTSRYTEKSVETLVETMRHSSLSTKNGYALEFASKADRLGDEYGHNYWRSRLYDAMAQSEAFLDLLV